MFRLLRLYIDVKLMEVILNAKYTIPRGHYDRAYKRKY